MILPSVNNSIWLVLVSSILISCGSAGANSDQDNSVYLVPNDEKAKAFWYDGNAEISSYKLEQARYGEIHEGTAVTVFVTEPFSKSSWTKADRPDEDAISVLKMNMTKKFNTGIYPYSLMTSTFFPFENGQQSLKISASMQEWCGHTYMEMHNEKQLEFKVDSYFEGETVDSKNLEKNYLEDDFWTMIRLNPKKIPTGEQQVIPSFFYMRLAHQPIAAQPCEINMIEADGEMTLSLNYRKLNRTVNINFESNFPHQILGWTETYESGYGSSRKSITTTATLMKSIRVDYWNKNKVSDSSYRKQLQLDE